MNDGFDRDEADLTSDGFDDPASTFQDILFASEPANPAVEDEVLDPADDDAETVRYDVDADLIILDEEAPAPALPSPPLVQQPPAPDPAQKRFEQRLRVLEDQLETLSEKIGLYGRAQAVSGAQIGRLVDARAKGLAKLVRADSEALREMIDQRLAEIETTAGSGSMTDGATSGSIAELISAQTAQVLEAYSRETAGQATELSSTLATSVERAFARLNEQLQAKVDGIAEVVAQRAAEAADMAIAGTIGSTLRRLEAAVEALDGVDTMVAEAQAMAEDRMATQLDERILSLAKMIRADNQALSQKVDRVAEAALGSGGGVTSDVDQEALLHLMRAVKESQANLANDLVGSLDRRFEIASEQLHSETQSTAESMMQIAEILGRKMDRLSVTVDDGYGKDLQVVIDRMSDAITAMSGRGVRRPE